MEMQTNRTERKLYVPPTFDVQHVMLEGDIAVQSPMQKVNVEDWVDEGPEEADNNADIWLIM